jgi:hypothetical protein
MADDNLQKGEIHTNGLCVHSTPRLGVYQAPWTVNPLKKTKRTSNTTFFDDNNMFEISPSLNGHETSLGNLESFEAKPLSSVSTELLAPIK